MNGGKANQTIFFCYRFTNYGTSPLRTSTEDGSDEHVTDNSAARIKKRPSSRSFRNRISFRVS
jgi:hypothetical protein